MLTAIIPELTTSTVSVSTLISSRKITDLAFSKSSVLGMPLPSVERMETRTKPGVGDSARASLIRVSADRAW